MRTRNDDLSQPRPGPGLVPDPDADPRRSPADPPRPAPGPVPVVSRSVAACAARQAATNGSEPTRAARSHAGLSDRDSERSLREDTTGQLSQSTDTGADVWDERQATRPARRRRRGRRHGACAWPCDGAKVGIPI